MANSTQRGRLLGLAHIGIMVKDAEVSMDFYMNKLGFELQAVQEMGPTKLVFLNAGTCQIELVQKPDLEPRQPGPVDHIAIEVEDIEPLMERLKAQGVRFETETFSFAKDLLGGVRNVFFRGPDDERIEFFDYMKK